MALKADRPNIVWVADVQPRAHFVGGRRLGPLGQGGRRVGLGRPNRAGAWAWAG